VVIDDRVVFYLSLHDYILRIRPTVCVSGGWAGEEKAWEEDKLEARKMLLNSYSAHPSAARLVGRTAYYRDYVFIIVLKCGAALSCFEEVERK